MGSRIRQLIKASALSDVAGIGHGFFTRQGGHSSGIYASKNTGLRADEDTEVVLKNRRLVAANIGAKEVVTPYQYHSSVAIIVESAWDWQSPPKADAIVTNQKGLGLAVNTADCTPVIFADTKNGVIGIAHSGWKGTVGGVVEATIAGMEKLGSFRGDIVAAIGPTISQRNYEVGAEFVEQFLADNPESGKFFVDGERVGHSMFDLPGCVEERLRACNLKQVQNLDLCTYADEERFFSYRRMTHRSEVDYGRQMSAICLI